MKIYMSIFSEVTDSSGEVVPKYCTRKVVGDVSSILKKELDELIDHLGQTHNMHQVFTSEGKQFHMQHKVVFKKQGKEISLAQVKKNLPTKRRN